MIVDKITQDEYSLLMSKLVKLETHIINLIHPIQQITQALRSPDLIREMIKLLKTPVQIDSTEFKSIASDLKISAKEITEASKKTGLVDFTQEVKFMAQRLDAIEKSISSMEKDGIDKKIDLSFTCDGYTLVKKPVGYRKDDQIEEPVDNLLRLLDLIPRSERDILISRLGLMGEKKKKFSDMECVYNVSAARLSQLFQKSLRRLRKPKLKDMLLATENSILIKAVMNGYE